MERLTPQFCCKLSENDGGGGRGSTRRSEASRRTWQQQRHVRRLRPCGPAPPRHGAPRGDGRRRAPARTPRPGAAPARTHNMRRGGAARHRPPAHRPDAASTRPPGLRRDRPTAGRRYGPTMPPRSRPCPPALPALPARAAERADARAATAARAPSAGAPSGLEPATAPGRRRRDHDRSPAGCPATALAEHADHCCRPPNAPSPGRSNGASWRLTPKFTCKAAGLKSPPGQGALRRFVRCSIIVRRRGAPRPHRPASRASAPSARPWGEPLALRDLVDDVPRRRRTCSSRDGATPVPRGAVTSAAAGPPAAARGRTVAPGKESAAGRRGQVEFRAPAASDSSMGTSFGAA